MPHLTIPDGLKRSLLPFWNGAHLRAWRLGEHVGALWHRRYERCAVCGRFGPMLYRRWVVPPKLEAMWCLSPREANALARKESCDCWACGAKLRCRRLARVVLDHFGDGSARSLRAWARGARARELAIAEINHIDGVHEALAHLPGLAASEYGDDLAPDTSVDGRRREDLMRLTYADARFDLLLSSETLEHVADLDAALRETYRVLKPGGAHIFTCPVRPFLQRGYARAIVRDDGSTQVLAPLYHPGGDEGYLVYHEFGADFVERVRAAGFEVQVHFGPVREDDLAQVYVARRPLA